MLPPQRAYLTGAIAAFASQGISTVAGVLSLWLLVRILETEAFAAYSVVMAVVYLVGYSAGFGIDRAMLLQIAERRPDRRVLAGATQMWRTLAVVALSSGIVAVLMAVFSDRLPAAQQAEIPQWIVMLAPVVPALALNQVLITWYQANHRVGISQLMQGLMDGTRCLVFVFAFALGLGSGTVALAAIVAALLPVAVLGFMAWGRTVPEPARMGWREVVDGFQFFVMRLSTIGLRRLDLIAMGAFSVALETAHYAIASRIAALVAIGHNSFMNTYTPRVRRHLHLEDHAAVAREYRVTRVLAFTLTTGAAVVLMASGRQVMDLFGGFAAGYPVLLVLLAGQLVQAGTGQHAAHLSMSGDLGWSMANRVLSLGVFAIALVALVPPHGGLGAAGAFVIANTFHGLTGAAILWHRTGLVAIPGSQAVALMLGTGALTTAALVPDLWTAALIGLIASGLLVALTERRMLRRLLPGGQAL